jgi:hypothetical protein
MEMRPAKGRADIILGRERFRCSRCGAKAAAYFNIDDLEDPRAIARYKDDAQQHVLCTSTLFVVPKIILRSNCLADSLLRFICL